LAEDGCHVLKFARNYGFVPVLKEGFLLTGPGTPGEYLVRQSLCEEIFPTDLRVEGLTEAGHFVVSQRAIRGGHPTVDAVAKYLAKLGFVNLPARFGQGGGAWFHRGLGVFVMDTSPDNFIAAKQGIVPIDLQICEIDGPLSALAGEVERLLRLAPRISRG